MAPPILIASRFTDAVVARATQMFDARPTDNPAMNGDELVAAAEACQAQAIIGSGRVKHPAAVIERLPASVKMIATATVGFDHVDLPAAKARGIMVTNTPDVLSDATADLAMMLLLCAARRAREYLHFMEAGWGRMLSFEENLGVDVGARTLGIVGMGRIGQAMARRAKAFGMKVIYHNRNRLPPELEQGATYYASLDEMLPHCGAISLHAPFTGKVILDAAAFARLPVGVILVNTGRGQLIDEEAMIAALQSGRILAAGLDVFASEPNFDARLRDMPNVFLTPHAGSSTIETRNAMGLRALANIEQVLLAGTEPRDRVA